ncbi:MAG: bifunctional adenosylcobinamide kinase/adenosylcobinamide-phosphate guanylyltransferase [Planctomycetota bacterium]|jgi:adenosylcobinamide kinase/adenosylcobinamide-phosphate guanylyltransferase
MAEIIMVAGGSRSGKSKFAEEMLSDYTEIAYVATLQTLDSEMKERAALHRKRRPDSWQTIEEYYNLAEAIDKVAEKTEAVLIDCFTGLLSNLLLKESENCEKINGKMLDQLLGILDNDLYALRESRLEKIVIVTNEVGCGVIPTSNLGRAFADLQGWGNQLLAKKASEVYLLRFGISERIK